MFLKVPYLTFQGQQYFRNLRWSADGN